MAVRSLSAMGLVLLLAACGGGGGGSGGGSSSSAVGSATAQGSLVLPNSGGSSTLIAENGTPGGLRLVQVSGGGTASVSVGGGAQTWQRRTAVFGDVGVYRTTDGTRAVVTSDGGSSSAAAVSSLTYTSFGVWLEASASAALDSSSDEITGAGGFVIGEPTPPSDMPGTGSASYTGEAVAVELQDGAVPRALSGSFDASVDFATGTIDAGADLRDATNGSSFGRVSMDGLGISGNTFSGTARAGSRSGTVNGGFAGPGASEMGGSFELDGPSTVHGAFAGSSR